MTMYYCHNCGEDFSDFPMIFLARNILEPSNMFEEKFDEFCRKAFEGYKQTHPESLELAWKNFWNWIGDTKMAWLCSEQCAIEFLQKENFLLEDEKYSFIS